jgi:V8-like Glu-specific endopeptidase
MKKILVLLLLLLCSCAALPIPTTALRVDVDTSAKSYSGTGVLIERAPEGDYVLTAGHVLEDPKFDSPPTFAINGWFAHKVGAIRAMTSEGFADLGLLLVRGRLDSPVRQVALANLVDDRIVQVHTKTEVKEGTLTRGILSMRTEIIPGDSGSPVLQDGQVVGIIYAYTTDDGDGLFVRARTILSVLSKWRPYEGP